MPCADCRGWLEADGTVMDRATTIVRYPYMAQVIGLQPAESQPDFPGVGAGERLLWLTGALARTLLVVIFAAIAFVIMLVIVVSLAQGATLSRAGGAFTHASALIQSAPASCPAGVPVQVITVINQAHVRPFALAKVENAVVAQSMQLRAAWGTPCVVFASGGWPVYLRFGGSDTHYIDVGTQVPWATVATSGVAYVSWSSSFSHEVIEMLADPSTTRPYTHTPESGNLEVADPVEDRAYRLDGVYVSDFVLPAWYAGGTDGVCETDAAPAGDGSGWVDTISCSGDLIAPADAAGPYDQMGILAGPWQVAGTPVG